MSDAPAVPNAAPAPAATPPAATPPAATPPVNPLDRTAPVDPAMPAAGDPPPGNSWRDSLPDDLKADKTLERYKSVEDLARGHVEARKIASSKVVLPTEGDEASFTRFVASVRPESPDAYKIDLPQGADAGFAEAMRPVFHEAGLLPQQAAKLVEANNAYAVQLAQQRAVREASAVDGLKAEMGEAQFERKKVAAAKLFDRIGISADFDQTIATMLGSVTDGQGGAAFLRLAFELADRSGELGSITADDVNLSLGNMTAEQAIAKATEMSAQHKTKLNPTKADFDPALKRQYDAYVAHAERARQG